MTYTREQMIAYARRLMGLEHVRADCNAVQTDGIDVDALIADSIRQWYLQLLRTGDVKHLELKEVALTGTTPAGGGGGSQYTLPADCVRLVWVQLPGWHHATAVEDASRLPYALACELNPYSRATVRTPVAVATADSRRILAWPAAGEYGSLRAYGAVDTGAGTYTFNESALSTLPEHLSNLKITDYASF